MTTVGQWVAWLCIRWHRTRPLENMVGDFDEDIGDDQVRSRHKTTSVAYACLETAVHAWAVSMHYAG